jgi:hypothetical protein
VGSKSAWTLTCGNSNALLLQEPRLWPAQPPPDLPEQPVRGAVQLRSCSVRWSVRQHQDRQEQLRQDVWSRLPPWHLCALTHRRRHAEQVIGTCRSGRALRHDAKVALVAHEIARARQNTRRAGQDAISHHAVYQGRAAVGRMTQVRRVVAGRPTTVLRTARRIRHAAIARDRRRPSRRCPRPWPHCCHYRSSLRGRQSPVRPSLG